MAKIDYHKLIEDETKKLKKWKKYCKDFFKRDDFLTKSKFGLEFPEFYDMGFTLNFKVRSFYKEYKDLYLELKALDDGLVGKMREHNNALYAKRIDEFKSVSPTIEDKTLDTQQLRAIVRDDKNQLVIAGAGSGKTTTIVGKVKYLIKVKGIKPEEILLLSYTNVGATDMNIRIKKETGLDFDVFTFHKLGYNIIKKVSSIDYHVFEGSFYNLIKVKLQNLLKEDEYLNNFLNYMEKGRLDLRDEFSFKTEEDYLEYLEVSEPTTLRDEDVKSYGELEIANFLFKNGIDYVYENRYKVLIADNNKKEYKPKFYLPEYDIYIEYYEVDKNNNVPVYLGDKKNYLDGMEWKKKCHEDNGTTLVECFYYDRKSGKLLNKLKRSLKKLGVKFCEKDDKELWWRAQEYQKNFFYEIIKSIETIVNLIKSNDYTIDDVKNLCSKDNKSNDMSLINLVEPIYDYYNEVLISEEKIDFNDMINKARKYVEDGEYNHEYKYVIVDEYQDISKSRYRLLKALRETCDFKLFCVGDDWQSIYRFAGSDVSYITNFDEYWGETHISKIEHTYRYSNDMSLISGEFIMQNNKQIKKKMVGSVSDKFPLGFITCSRKITMVNALRKRLDYLEKDSTILFIGRYDKDFDFITNSKYVFDVKYDYLSNVYYITYLFRKDLRIVGLTAHKSKGLEADYVFILNNKNSVSGFPSRIADLPIINLLLEKNDSYPFAEERRLFYVALTRSKKKTFLLTMEGRRSIFVKELDSKYGKQIKKEAFECPSCGGELVRKHGLNGEFWGCTNYKKDGSGCNYSRDRF